MLEIQSEQHDSDSERDGAWCDQCGAHHGGDCSDEPEDDETTLRCTINTPAMGDAIRMDAGEALEIAGLRSFFEHGQWWVEDPETGAQWSVCDAETATGEQYFDYEQVSQGDEG